ncbi:MAG: methyltransferase [Pseudomonadota bacterium]
MRHLTLSAVMLIAAGTLAGCGGDDASTPATPATPAADAQPAAAPAPDAPSLAAVLDAQDDAAKARYGARHPAETLEFFGIKPGMRVVEALPGGGWYSKILMSYLGSDGELIGVNYEYAIWELFGFLSEEDLEEQKTWATDWPEEARGWGGENSAKVSGYIFGGLPAELDGEVDAVLMIRALHNMARFEDQGQFLTTAIADSLRILKPGGTLGVVQHRASDAMPDEAVGGGQGYLRQQFVIDTITNGGFEFVGMSQVNANPNDQPGAEDVVWRLPPTYFGTKEEDTEGRAALDAIGESDRMTLLFRKPE